MRQTWLVHRKLFATNKASPLQTDGFSPLVCDGRLYSSQNRVFCNGINKSIAKRSFFHCKYLKLWDRKRFVANSVAISLFSSSVSHPLSLGQPHFSSSLNLGCRKETKISNYLFLQFFWYSINAHAENKYELLTCFRHQW